MRLLRAGIAAVVLVALLITPPWLLVRYIGNPWPPGGVALSAPLTDEAIIGLLAIVVWLMWAQFTICVLAETAAALTDDRVSLRTPATFALQQRLARRLVATIVIATVSTPILGAGGAAALNDAATQLHRGTEVVHPSLGGATGTRDLPKADDGVPGQPHEPAPAPGAPAHERLGGLSGPAAASAAERAGNTSRTVTVMRLDTLWSIAERVLGSGERWPEIATLNEGRAMGDGAHFTSADHIRPGWQLIVPHEEADDHPGHRATAAAAPVETAPVVEIHRGDSLWSIAEHKLGDGDEWPRIYQANRAEIGTDPDLIYPGQVIELPLRPAPAQPAETHTPADHHGAGSDDRRRPPTPVTDPDPTRPTDPQTSPSAETAEGPASQPSTPTSSETSDEATSPESDLTVLRALLATAICLAAGLGAALVANRQRQMRARRPGRAIAEPSRELARLERAVHDAESEARPATELIDLALRHLAVGQRARQEALPALAAAILDHGELTLLFAHPPISTPPTGWNATDEGWSFDHRTNLAPELRAQPAPYPALVSVGIDDRGRTWLLDLEQQGTVTVTGDDPADVLRFVVAELAVNAWSQDTTTLLVEDALPELRTLNPARVRPAAADHARRRAEALLREGTNNQESTILTRRRDDLAVESASPLIVVVTSDEPELREPQPGRRDGVILLRTTGERPTLDLIGPERLHLVGHGIEIRPFRLKADQASSVALLLVATGVTHDEPMPPASDQTTIGQLTNADGSVREELTVPRGLDPLGQATLLPGSEDDYTRATATSPQDLDALAPIIPDPAREQLLEADPALEQDLKDWFDERSPRPRVRVLGPVDATAVGGEPDSVTTLGGTVEFVVYLACQDRGVTKERAAEDLAWSGATVQNRARDARRLLGQRPDGGEWLPDAAKSDSARRRGVATYQLHTEVQVDADLFRRLRTRAAARGADGLEDLVLALSLVTGEPFEQLRRGGYGWLLEGDRLDHHMCAAIADVAHLVADRALLAGDLDLARRACQIGIRVNPYSDVARLDLAAVTAAEGGNPDDVVRHDVVNRTDADLTERTDEVLRRRGWLAS